MLRHSPVMPLLGRTGARRNRSTSTTLLMTSIEFYMNNWGNLASVIGLVISCITLARVARINKAQREEREVLRKVLDLEELYIKIEETILVLNETLRKISVADNPNASQLRDVLTERINALSRASEKFRGALNALSTIRGDSLLISPSHFERGQEYLWRKCYIAARSEFQKALNFYNASPLIDSAPHLAEVYYYLARCSLDMEDMASAKMNLTMAVKYASRLSDIKLKQLIGELSLQIDDKELMNLLRLK